MSKETKTIELPVKYKKTKRFNKKDIVEVDEQASLFSKTKVDTVIFTNKRGEYYIDLPPELVKQMVFGKVD